VEILLKSGADVHTKTVCLKLFYLLFCIFTCNLNERAIWDWLTKIWKMEEQSFECELMNQSESEWKTYISHCILIMSYAKVIFFSVSAISSFSSPLKDFNVESYFFFGFFSFFILFWQALYVHLDQLNTLWNELKRNSESLEFYQPGLEAF